MDSSARITTIACFSHRYDRHRMGIVVLVILWCIAWFIPEAWSMDGDTSPRKAIEIPRAGKLPFIAVEQISDSDRLLLASEAGLFEWQAPSSVSRVASTPVDGLTPSQIDTQVERRSNGSTLAASAWTAGPIYETIEQC